MSANCGLLSLWNLPRTNDCSKMLRRNIIGILRVVCDKYKDAHVTVTQ